MRIEVPRRIGNPSFGDGDASAYFDDMPFGAHGTRLARQRAKIVDKKGLWAAASRQGISRAVRRMRALAHTPFRFRASEQQWKRRTLPPYQSNLVCRFQAKSLAWVKARAFLDHGALRLSGGL